MKLSIKLAVAGFASAVLFALPSMSAPLSVFPNGASVDSQALQAQARAVARGGVHRGAAVRHGAAYRGGRFTVVERPLERERSLVVQQW